MSMYSIPRSPVSGGNQSGSVLPSSIVKIREKRKGSGGSFADSDDNSRPRDSEKSKPFVPFGGRGSTRRLGDTDLVLKSSASRADQEGGLLRGMSSATAVLTAPSQMLDASSRSYMNRRSSDHVKHGSTLHNRGSISGVPFVLGVVWAVITVALTMSFVLLYWLQVVPDEQNKVSLMLLESASVVAASYFAPMISLLLAYEASIGAGIIASSSDIAHVSQASYPYFYLNEYIVEVEFLFSATDSLRVRPSSGPTRILSCLNEYPSSTNSNPIPTIYAATCSDIDYCLYGVVCENSDYVAPTTLSANIDPYIFVPQESPQTQIVAISLLGDSPVQISASLSSLSFILAEVFPSELIFVVSTSGANLGTSQPEAYPPVTLEDGSLLLAVSVYDYDWSYLLPADISSVDDTWSSGVHGGWELGFKRITSNYYVLVVTSTEDYTSYTLWILGIATLSIALLPTIYLTFITVIDLVRTARVRWRSRS